jgi:hypothetical protein
MRSNQHNLVNGRLQQMPPLHEFTVRRDGEWAMTGISDIDQFFNVYRFVQDPPFRIWSGISICFHILNSLMSKRIQLI